MSSSIGSIGSNASAMMAMRGMHRPDPAQMAEKLFSQLDASGQGYIQKSDLQAAFDKMASASATSSSSSSAASGVDDLFSKLDTNSDGKVTKQEFSDTLKQLAEQLDQQFQNLRMSGAMQGAGGTPPPPPPQGGGSDAGFTKDELTAQLKEIGSSDSKRASLISNIVNNFDKADTDGDGKVSFKEAMAYDQANPASSSTASASSTSGSGDTTSSSSAASDLSAKLAMQIMRLMQAYGIGESSGSASATLSVSA